MYDRLQIYQNIHTANRKSLKMLFFFDPENIQSLPDYYYLIYFHIINLQLVKKHQPIPLQKKRIKNLTR